MHVRNATSMLAFASKTKIGFWSNLSTFDFAPNLVILNPKSAYFTGTTIPPPSRAPPSYTFIINSSKLVYIGANTYFFVYKLRKY